MAEDLPPVPVVPYEDPEQRSITTEPAENPFSLGWYTAQTITDIPEDSVGWLVAQGWQITDIRYDETTKPPTAYYTMARLSMQNWEILNTLLGEWTFAHNSALKNNNDRYNDVVADWEDMLASSQVQFEAQVAEQNAHVGLYLGDLVTYMDEVDGLIKANQTSLVADAAVATTALTALDDKLDDLEANVTGDHTTTIEALLSDQAGYLNDLLTDLAAELTVMDNNYSAYVGEITALLQNANTDLETFVSSQSALRQTLEQEWTNLGQTLSTLLTEAGTYLDTIETDIDDVLTNIASDYTDVDTDVNALLTEGDAAMDNHATDYNAVLALLASDYNDHKAVAESFLVDLGTTEVARINEAFNASLSTEMQQLIDRGLYSSDVAGDKAARNTRDRDEQIQALNDRLNREKLENQHRLYGQQTAMRTGTMAGKDRIHTVQQEVWRYQASQITGLYGLLQAMRDRTLTGKQAIYAIKDANNRLKIELQSKLYSLGHEMRRVLLEEVARLQQLSQAVTQWTAGERGRLIEQAQHLGAKHVAAVETLHAAQQSVSQTLASEWNTLLGQLQDAVRGLLDGKKTYAALTMENASILTRQRHQMIIEMMNEVAFREQGGQKKHEESQKLLAYQLDERNKLLVGLYGFVERRSDIGPAVEDLAKICTSLSDSGGGWLTP